MSIRVAKYRPNEEKPKIDGYRTILIHTSDKTLGGDLSPYVLKDEKGRLLENIWQFSKVYPKVSKQRIPLGRYYQNIIIWEHPEETHFKDNDIIPYYWEWRKKGMKNEYAVRYPNGYHGRHTCVFSLWPTSPTSNVYEELDYIEARKKIYCGEYIRLAPHTKHFQKLKKMFESGTNLLIVEVDGPDYNLDYPPYDQISKDNPGLDITEKNIKRLLNDPKKPFGHGYVIATLLLGKEEWLK